MNKYMVIMTITETLNELNDKFDSWTNKITADNSFFAGVITIVFFVAICLGLSKFADK